MKEWSKIYTYKVAQKKYDHEQDEKRSTTSFKLLQTMTHQVNHNPINSIVFEITQKYLHTDIYNNIIQCIDHSANLLGV